MRIKVVQGQMTGQAAPVSARRAGKTMPAAKTAPRGPVKRGLTAAETDALHKGLADIDNDRLKQTLETLGRGVYSRQPRAKP